MTLAKGKFDVAPANSETTRLEASLSFITVQNLYATNDVIRQIKAEICLNRKKLVGPGCQPLLLESTPIL